MVVVIDNTEYVCKQIPSFPEYAATEDGKIISLRYKGHPGVVRFLNPSANEKGYLAVNLRKDGILYRKKVHRLVVEAFLGPIKDGLEVNHKDEDKLNNTLSNLELVTHTDNINYGTHNARARMSKILSAKRKGDSPNAVKITLEIGGVDKEFGSVMEAIEAVGVSKRQFYLQVPTGTISKNGKVLAVVKKYK